VPDLLQPFYDNQQPLKMQTYSSLNNSLKRNSPVFVFNSDTRRTTSHAFRYLFAKQAYAQLGSVTEVAQLLGHINEANTARYIFDKIYTYQ
jgi:integrase